MGFAFYPDEDVKSEDDGSELQQISPVRTAPAVKERLFQRLQEHIKYFRRCASSSKQGQWVFFLFVCLVFSFRLMEAFVSIQLEKVSLRDEMLSLFVKKSQAARSVVPPAVSGASRTAVTVGCQHCSALVNF